MDLSNDKFMLVHKRVLRKCNNSAKPLYRSFENRFKSFDHWFRQNPSPLSIARAGFYAVSRSDIFDDVVSCFHCGMTVSHWQDDDNPYLEHLKFSPSNCKYVYMVLDHLLKNDFSDNFLNEKFPESLNCVACVEEMRSVVFLPCKHLCFCYGCSKDMATCPVCRQRVNMAVKIFIP